MGDEKTMGSMGMNFWKDKKVFITGADGFIGGWIAKTLIEKEANVTVVIRDTKREDSLDLHNIRKKVNIVKGDIVDYPLMQRIMNEYSIQYVFHLAAQPLVEIATRSPLSTFESNIKGTWNILESARLTKTVEGVIVASSDKAYGNQEKLPYSEDQPLQGIYPYDASKVCTDVLTRSYFISFGLPVIVTRNANTYGGGDLNFGRMIPGAIISSLQGKEMNIRSDGTPERDFIYIIDVVNSYLSLAENIKNKNVVGNAFNTGSGNPIQVIDLFKLVTKLTGNKIEPKVLGEATNEIDKQYLSTEKIKKTIGWKAKYTLEEGLKETIEWYRNYLVKKGKI